jgi:hypothetical protein
MATGPGQNTDVVQPRVSELISLPPVEPRGTSSLVDAFHKGFVTADDIIGRIDNRARLKKKAEEQLYQEQLSPAARDARAAVQQATAVEAKARVQKAELDAAEMPYVKEMRRTEAARKIAQAESFGTIDAVANQFTMLGVELPVRQDPKTGLTVPDQARIRQVYEEDVAPLLLFRSSVNDRIKQLKDQEFTVGKGKGQGVLDMSGRLNPAQAMKLRENLYPMTAIPLSLWKSLGRPASPDVFLNTAPGTVAAASAAPAAAPAATVAPGVGQMTPEGIVMTTVPGEGGEPGTEKQILAKSSMGRFATSAEIQEELARRQFNPASVGTYIYEHLPEFFRSENVKLYQAAKNAWSQGVLRMESGAAISSKEQSWYEGTFFPKVGDSSTVQSAKATLRADMEKVISDIATAGGAATPDLKADYDSIRVRAAKVSGWAGEKGTRDPETLGFEKVYRADGKILWRKDGQTFEADTGAAAPAAPAAAPVAPVKSAPINAAPVVEPRYTPRFEPPPVNPWAEMGADLVNPFRAFQRNLKK